MRKIGYLQPKNTKKIPTLLGSLPTPFKILGTPLKWKVGASVSVCRVTLCVYCWVHFVTIAKMYGNLLISGCPSKVLPWSWLKSLGLGLGLGTRSLGLGLGLEVQSLGLGLDKKFLFTSVCSIGFASLNIVIDYQCAYKSIESWLPL